MNTAVPSLSLTSGPLVNITRVGSFLYTVRSPRSEAPADAIARAVERERRRAETLLIRAGSERAEQARIDSGVFADA
jgi:uncharacterized protein YggE